MFASHNWGAKGLTHLRVKHVVQILRQRGFHVWFDEDNLEGNILSSMCKGIDEANIVLIFVTREYIEKVKNGGEDDNCRREFMYAASNAKPMLAIRFDSHLPSKWDGPVGMILGSHCYVDMTVTSSEHFERLERQITMKQKMQMEKKMIKRFVTNLMQAPATNIPSIRNRAIHVLTAYGFTVNEGERTCSAIDRLLESTIGHVPPSLTLLQKIVLSEKELGIKPIVRI